jgi:hypothetical protein
MVPLRLTITPWASWPEWEGVYTALFSLDDDKLRAMGVQCVELWRSRGHVPLAVDATSGLTETILAESHLGVHALTLMYAMSITRLVNGLVDPMQHGQRAASVHGLARELGLPPSMVELRHESTHNRLPSLSRLRLAADQALLWLHQHYWQPQRSVIADTPRAIADSLARFRAANLERCLRGVTPLRQDVVAVALELDHCLNPVQLRTHLLAQLLDGGFLVPPQDWLDGAPPGCGETCAVEAGLEWETDVLQRLWGGLLVRLQRRRSLLPLGSALLVECVTRMVADASHVRPGAHPAPADARPATCSGGGTRRAARVRVLFNWALHLVRPHEDGGTQMQVDGYALQHVAWLALREPRDWGRPLLEMAMTHAEWPAHLAAGTRRLLQAASVAQRLRESPARGTTPSEGEEEPPVVLAVGEKLHLLLAPQRLTATSPWAQCQRWVPVAIGETPMRCELAGAIEGHRALDETNALGNSTASSAGDSGGGLNCDGVAGGEEELGGAVQPAALEQKVSALGAAIAGGGWVASPTLRNAALPTDVALGGSQAGDVGSAQNPSAAGTDAEEVSPDTHDGYTPALHLRLLINRYQAPPHAAADAVGVEPALVGGSSAGITPAKRPLSFKQQRQGASPLDTASPLDMTSPLQAKPIASKRCKYV